VEKRFFHKNKNGLIMSTPNQHTPAPAWMAAAAKELHAASFFAWHNDNFGPSIEEAASIIARHAPSPAPSPDTRELVEESREILCLWDEVKKLDYDGAQTADKLFERLRATIDKAMSCPTQSPAGNMRELVEALKFYADPRKYQGPNQSPETDEEEIPGGYRLDVTRDRGEKARQALATHPPTHTHPPVPLPAQPSDGLTGDARSSGHSYAEWKEYARLEKDVDECAMFICRLVRALGKDRAISKAAMQYLTENDLLGSPMRNVLEPSPAPHPSAELTQQAKENGT
jgi:hypothetical protein